jgi:phenylalanine-4-hydroxylase
MILDLNDRNYSSTLKRPFSVRYNALTQNLEVLDSKDRIMRYANGIRSDLKRLIDAVDKFSDE